MPINQAAIDQLKAAGFLDTLPPVPQRLISQIAGEEKTGKSHLSLTGPGPVIYHSIDVGTEGVVEKFQQQGKQIFVKEIRYQRGEPKSVYEDMWQTFKKDFDLGLSMGQGTVVLDTWTEVYELARLAKFGKLEQVQAHHYGPVYAELRGMIRDIYNTPMSACLLTKMAKDYTTKELTEKGFGDTGFLVQLNARTSRTIGADGKPVYNLWIKDSRLNAKNLTNLTLTSNALDANGQTIDQFDFSYLLYLAHNWAG